MVGKGVSDTIRHMGYKVLRAAGMENGLVKQMSRGQDDNEGETGKVSLRTMKGPRLGGGRGLERGEILGMSGIEYFRPQKPIPNTGGEKG